jgi:Outer membrane protein beta-barrel domain
MKTKLILTGVLLLLMGVSIYGQEKKQDKNLKFIYLESGIDFISCGAPDKDYIRADIDPFYTSYASDYIRSLMYNEYFGVKFEYRILKNLLGVSGGVRYNRMVSSIGKTSYWSDTPDFFYVRYWSDGTATEYAKVLEINQKSDFIGIPVELRIYPYKDYPVNVYFKAGASFNINVGSKTGIVFQDENMDPYKANVTAVVEGPPSYYGSFHLGVGLKIRRLEKPGIILEAAVPVAILIPGEANFVTPQTGAGIQFMIRVPIIKKAVK